LIQNHIKTQAYLSCFIMNFEIKTCIKVPNPLLPVVTTYQVVTF